MARRARAGGSEGMPSWGVSGGGGSGSSSEVTSGRGANDCIVEEDWPAVAVEKRRGGETIPTIK